MIKIIDKKECCGCYACKNICPKDCIDMNIDEEGFWYPKVDTKKCINCNLCEKVCPFIEDPKKEEFNHTAYACKNKNEQVRLESSSGGVFSNLCEYVIGKGGVVFGAAFNENLEVEHMEATTIEECKKFRGSKYVQSKVGDCYIKIKEYLNDGRLVLFSGVPCQIEGLNLYLRKSYSNLINVDVICHGVPSPLVFSIYKMTLSKEYLSNIVDIKFRDKTEGWKKFSYLTKFENNSIYRKLLNEDNYMKGFLSDLYLRPSCYDCKSKDFKSNSDILLGDYWGIQDIHPEFDDDKGVSLVIVNSIKGKEVFDCIYNNMDVIDTNIDYAITKNTPIIKSVTYNKNRDKFFSELKYNNLYYLIDKYTKLPLISKIIINIRIILSKLKMRILNYNKK